MISQLSPTFLSRMVSHTQKPTLVVALDVSKNNVGSAFTVLPPAAQLPLDAVPRNLSATLGPAIQRLYRPTESDNAKKSRNLPNDMVLVNYLNDLVLAVDKMAPPPAPEHASSSPLDLASLDSLTASYSDKLAHQLVPAKPILDKVRNINGPFFVVGWPVRQQAAADDTVPQRAVMNMVEFLKNNKHKYSSADKFFYCLVDESYSTVEVHEANPNPKYKKGGQGKERMPMEDSYAAKIIMDRFITADGAGDWDLIN